MPDAVRLATPNDAERLARLLHDFNTEFGTPSPGPAVLAPRVARLLAGDRTFAVVAGEPIIGFGLVTLRPNVWFDGPVALLDELYVAPSHRNRGLGTAMLARIESTCRARDVGLVEINVDDGDADARRLYQRHGYRCSTPDEPEPARYYWRDLTE